MSAPSLETIPAADPFDGLDFFIVVDAPHLTIVYTEGRFRGRTRSDHLSMAVMVEVARGHGLLVDEVVDPGWGSFEITFRECGTI